MRSPRVHSYGATTAASNLIPRHCFSSWDRTRRRRRLSTSKLSPSDDAAVAAAFTTAVRRRLLRLNGSEGVAAGVAADH